MNSVSGKGSCGLLNYAMIMSNSRKVRPKPSGDDSGNNTSITGPHSSLISDNVDIIAQILVRLPVKYLLRSKSVSKTWLSVVTAPSFVRNYSVRNRRSVSGLFLNQEGKYEFIPLVKQNGTRGIEKGKGRKRTRNNTDVARDFSFKTLNFLNVPGRIKIEQSCNGLLCCSHSVMNSRYKPEVAAYYIYNPSTKSYKIVPESPFRQDGNHSVHSMSLAFDPLKSPYYEVICFSSDNKEKAQMEIYSSETSSWRLCKAPFEAKYNEFGFFNLDMNKSGVFWNGSLHWEAVYFDIYQELLKEMPKLPAAADYNNTDEDEDEDDSYTNDDDDDSRGDSDDDDTEDSMSVEYFGESGGHLFLIQISDPHGSFKFRILEMESGYTGWNVIYRGNLKKMTRQYPKLMLDEYAVQYNFGLDFSILLVEEKEEEEESVKMVIRVIDKVISYDLKKKRFESIHKLPFAAGPELDSPAWFEAYQFIQSLASV